MFVFPGNSGFLNKVLDLRLDANLTVLAMSEPPVHSSGLTLRLREVKALFVLSGDSVARNTLVPNPKNHE